MEIDRWIEYAFIAQDNNKFTDELIANYPSNL